MCSRSVCTSEIPTSYVLFFRQCWFGLKHITLLTFICITKVPLFKIACVLITPDNSNTETANQTLSLLSRQCYMNVYYKWEGFNSSCGLGGIFYLALVSRIVLAFDVFLLFLLWSGYLKTHWEMCAFCKYCTNTFGYKEMGHWGAKDVKVESALAR